MGYVTVKEETGETLHLCREPSVKAWAILVGCSSLGLGAAFYSNDYLVWKLSYIIGAMFIGISCFENWEECIFDKKKKQVHIQSQNIFQKTFPSKVATNIVAADLNELESVEVSEEDVKYAGKGYIVVLNFETGIKLGVTETASLGDKSELELIAQKITQFVGIKDQGSGESEESNFTDDIEIIPDEFDGSTAEKQDIIEVKEDDSVASVDVPVVTKIDHQEEVPVEIISSGKETRPSTIKVDVTLTTNVEAKTCHPQTADEDVVMEETSKPKSVSQPDTPESTSSDEGFEKIHQSAVEDIDPEAPIN